MISIIIPAYNEEKSLRSENFLKSLESELNNSNFSEYEILVINDGSTDETLNILKNTTSGKIRILDNYINKGYGLSIKRGINNAKFDIISIVDIDGTYQANYVVEAIKKYIELNKNKKNIDMVVAQRTGKYYRESLIKSILRSILRFLVEWSTGNKIPDINSGLRVFSKNTITPFFPKLSNAFSFTTTSTLSYLLTHKSIIYFKIEYLYRKGEGNLSKVKIVRDSLRTLQNVIEATIYYNPFKFFLLFSIILFLISIIFIILFIYSKIILFKNIFLILLLSSIISLLVGFISSVVKKE